MTVEYKSFQQTNSKPVGSTAPLSILWKNTRMIRHHSLTACAKEVLGVNIGLDVVKINLIGSPSTGKTTLAKSLAHLIHREADVPYTVKLFKREELLDMENTLSKLQPVNHILIFDDVSWLSAGNSKSKLDTVQKTFTEIRHLPGGQDIKVIIIFNFHYNLSIPKHLRQADFFCYTNLGSSELENTQKLVGNKNTLKLLDFKRITHEAYTPAITEEDDDKKKEATFSYKMGMMRGNIKFTYPMRKPFAPALWWNGDSLRHIVFPKREWIDLVCSVCGDASTDSVMQGDVKRFREDCKASHFNNFNIQQSLRIILMQRGINMWDKPTKRALSYVQKYLSCRIFQLEDLIKEYDLEELHVYRSKMPADISPTNKEQKRINVAARKPFRKEDFFT